MVVVGVSSCSFGTGTTNVRGKVTFEGKPIVGAEVRFAGSKGEDMTRTDHDGRYDLTIKNARTEELELKVLWPGYTHDDIKFKAYEAKDKATDIQLKKIFTPAPAANK